MRTVVHLSDLHFGRVDERLMAPLEAAIRRISPDLVAVSGDLTQRARRHEFVQARAFLDRLPFQLIVVPGNHDIPLYNLPARLWRPLAGYSQYIAQDLEPLFVDDEIMVVGLNSARSATLGGRGRLSPGQVSRAATRLAAAPSHLAKIVVTHHPFDLPDTHGPEHLIGRSHMAMSQLAPAGADVFLAGHLHVSHTGRTAERYKIAGHDALVVQAGTMSTRGRGELNSFNVIRIGLPHISVERHAWDVAAAAFTTAWTGAFQKNPQGWSARTA